MKLNKLAISISGFSFLILSISITLRLVLGNRILDNLYPYTSEGGNPLLKIHPGTWFLFSGVALFFIAIGHGRLLFNLTGSLKAISLALLATLALMAYATINWGLGGSAYLADTYLFAVVCILLATYLRHEHCSRLFYLIAGIIAVNSLIAILEYLTQSHLVPNPVTGTRFFRANALMAHPLNNALVALPAALAVLISPIKRTWRYAMIALVFMGMVAFASRASLAIYCTAVFLIVWASSFTARAGRQTRALYMIGAPAIIVLLSIAFYAAIFFTDFGTGISSRLTFDESALARLDSIDFFTSLNANDYFIGSGPVGFTSLVYSYSTVSVIENFWIQLVVSYGIPMCLVLFFGFAKLTKWIISKSSPQLLIAVTAFIVAASTNNSLSIKTVALTVFLLMLYLLRRLNEKSIAYSPHIHNQLG